MNRIALCAAILLALAPFAGSQAQAKGLKVTSPDMKAGGKIANEQVFAGFGCTGGNVSPALNWSGAPAKTKSFAVTVYDPDAPTGSGWWHWVIFNIPASAKGLAKNAGDLKANLAPQGSVQSRTDFGMAGWGGPCPPQGDKPHRYIFSVYALDVDKIDANADVSAAFIGFNLHFHTLAKGTLMARYGR